MSKIKCVHNWYARLLAIDDMLQPRKTSKTVSEIMQQTKTTLVKARATNSLLVKLRKKANNNNYYKRAQHLKHNKYCKYNSDNNCKGGIQ